MVKDRAILTTVDQ